VLWKICHGDIKAKLRFKHFLMHLFYFHSLFIFYSSNCAILSLLDNHFKASSSEGTAPERPLSAVLFALLSSPQKLLRLWNWKSASLSVILRGPIFFAAAVRQGWAGVAGALFTESAFCAISAGFYGAIVQSLKDAEPQWLTGVVLAFVIPALFQSVEYLLHWFRGTPHLRIAEIVSVIISGLSALFNWYAMRRGALLVGKEGASFGRDLGRLPRLIFGFLAVLPRKLASRAKTRSLELLTGALNSLGFGGRAS
jgi:hypothetical protein